MALAVACAPGAAPVVELEDAGLPHDGGPDAGSSDAGPRDAGASDAGAADAGHADAGHADAGAEDGGVADAGAGDAGLPLDGGWTGDYPIDTSVPHWRPTFADEFRGKPGLSTDAHCFDELPAQCTIWPGANTNNCDYSDVAGASMIPPLKANLAAALALFRPDRDWNAATEADVRAAYGDLIASRLQHLDKCTWSVYQMVNWMATDYAGRWSARFDPSRVTVDPAGKGYLQLSATTAPVQFDCVYGGTLGGPNCQVYGFAAGELHQGTAYWADADPRWPGVYYHPVNGGCPYGGTFTGVNCSVKSFGLHVLDEAGPAYWVDADPRWPGVYYANTAYRCRDNIDYEPVFGFRNLTCPILDGAILSMPAQKTPGFAQFQGRFEVKARIPKGLGAFPAAWLLPTEGGWPYKGGEIDILEARDAADEAYQTYHHGKCYDPGTGQEVAATDPNDCAQKGMSTVHLDLGYTARERATGEFWKRDHVFSVEWSEGHIVYFVNGVRLGSIDLGTQANLYPTSAPAGLATYNASNFPTKPFYWILNHSTYVANDKLPGWGPQTFLVDYVRTFDRCTRNFDFCLCGGGFVEGTGCRLGPGEPLHCPRGTTAANFNGSTYDAACKPADQRCPNGGTVSGTRCLVKDLTAFNLRTTAHYWADADPRWPGVYYAPIQGGCPYGGTFSGVNCTLTGLPADLLESGVDYVVEAAGVPSGIYYTPDFRQ